MKRDAKLAAALIAPCLLLLAACNLNMSPGAGANQISGPPVVEILAPLANSTYLEGVAVNVQARVSNAGADLARVDFSVDGQVFDSQLSPDGGDAFSLSASWQAAGAGAHLLGVVALRGDGSGSAPASVTVTVIGQAPAVGSGGGAPATGGGAGGPQDDQQAAEPTAAPPTRAPEPASDRPMGRVLRGAYVRSGPDTRFAPPIGSVAAGDMLELIAVHHHETWYKVNYYTGEGWVFAALLEVSGDVASLPKLWGPPLPEPTALPTTAAPTADPGANVSLVAGNMRHTGGGGQITCGVGFRVEVDVHNPNSVRSAGGVVHFLDHTGIDEQNFARVSASFPPIEPGQTIGVGTDITVTYHYKESHVLRACINRQCGFKEPDVADENHFPYTLQKGSCT